MTRLHLYVHAVSLDYTTQCYLYHNDVGDMIVLVLHLARSYLIIINYHIKYSKSTECVITSSGIHTTCPCVFLAKLVYFWRYIAKILHSLSSSIPLINQV